LHKIGSEVLAMYGWLVVAALLLGLWIAAVVTHFIVSAAIHLLLGAAVVLFVVGLVLGRRTAT
jgi:FtsH-binding integral membrane protein